MRFLIVLLFTFFCFKSSTYAKGDGVFGDGFSTGNVGNMFGNHADSVSEEDKKHAREACEEANPEYKHNEGMMQKCVEVVKAKVMRPLQQATGNSQQQMKRAMNQMRDPSAVNRKVPRRNTKIILTRGSAY